RDKLPQQLRRFRRRHGAGRQPFFQRAAGNALQREIRLSAASADLEDRNNVRVLQPRDNLSFVLKTLEFLRAGMLAGANDFQSHDTIELDLMSAIDHAHRAFAETLRDPITWDGGQFPWLERLNSFPPCSGRMRRDSLRNRAANWTSRFLARIGGLVEFRRPLVPLQTPK